MLVDQQVLLLIALDALQKSLRCTTACSVVSFKTALDCYLKNIVDHPCIQGFNNSLDAGDCSQWWSLRDVLVTKYILLNIQK